MKGYYTLSNTSVNRIFRLESIIKKLPPFYKHLTATLSGRLAVDIKYKGQSLGADFYWLKLKTVLSN